MFPKRSQRFFPLNRMVMDHSRRSNLAECSFFSRQGSEAGRRTSSQQHRRKNELVYQKNAEFLFARFRR